MRFWYLLRVFSKISNEHPRHFREGVPPGFATSLQMPRKCPFVWQYVRKEVFSCGRLFEKVLLTCYKYLKIDIAHASFIVSEIENNQKFHQGFTAVRLRHWNVSISHFPVWTNFISRSSVLSHSSVRPDAFENFRYPFIRSTSPIRKFSLSIWPHPFENFN